MQQCSNRYNYHWRIQVGRQRHLSANSFIFMQFSAKNLQNNGSWRPHLRKFLDPPLTIIEKFQEWQVYRIFEREERQIKSSRGHETKKTNKERYLEVYIAPVIDWSSKTWFSHFLFRQKSDFLFHAILWSSSNTRWACERDHTGKSVKNFTPLAQ